MFCFLLGYRSNKTKFREHFQRFLLVAGKIMTESKENVEEEQGEIENSNRNWPDSIDKVSPYDSAEFENLPVGSDVKDIFQFIAAYSGQVIETKFYLTPFLPDFIPVVCEPDAFLKVSRPDNADDELGLVVLDEPATNQSDPVILATLRTKSRLRPAPPAYDRNESSFYIFIGAVTLVFGLGLIFGTICTYCNRKIHVEHQFKQRMAYQQRNASLKTSIGEMNSRDHKKTAGETDKRTLMSKSQTGLVFTLADHMKRQKLQKQLHQQQATPTTAKKIISQPTPSTKKISQQQKTTTAPATNSDFGVSGSWPTDLSVDGRNAKKKNTIESPMTTTTTTATTVTGPQTPTE